MSLVHIDQALKKYGNKTVVDHLNLTVGSGEIFGLLGPNGAGKTTTIKMMCGLVSPNSGDIRIADKSIIKQPDEVKRLIGVVPQDIAIFSNLTAKENVTFFGKLYGLKGDLLRKRVEEALEFVSLHDRQNDRPGAFSGGMKRRLNIACAITHRPLLIIMDEPTVGIDPHSRNHILESVKQLNREGASIIYTSHYMEEISAICSKIAIMDYGRLVAMGTKEELRQKIAGTEKIVLEIKSMNSEATLELAKHPHIKNVEAKDDKLEITVPSAQSYIQDIIFILTKHQVAIKGLSIEEPDLEKMFLSLTGQELRD
ncbi:Linearmycin resistance ATP-binding protein LnrL [Paenibacillus plantiphilus]|uniref:Linearmycin resistance ATP-binding protein LnrL n=1 Tax=Paenibacillus plantiphilus TaxID=2905650 RepID=A0ABM9C3S7_9BACL|nr:ABC transporter ATP-binding protein [Paenibacillus plantiphilus]CAH1200604.1 Linearmycin resistance ATP-binding protein LnrL [Paenibacillus plantiphilus]